MAQKGAVIFQRMSTTDCASAATCINILITAVRNGELDNQLAPAKKPVTAMTTRKAA
jgi:hypothetical protein